MLRNAVEEALQLGHNYVGTEHLLLAVLKDETAVGAVVLARLGISYEIVSGRITEVLSGYGNE
jgi:ATP-dependent Clp protease ATP-binding subunit ClpC